MATHHDATAAPDPRRNAILARLPSAEYNALLSRLSMLDATIRDCMYEKYGPMPSVYFPLDTVISLVTTAEQGASVEVTTIGNEGMVGLPVFLGAETSPNYAFCQIPGRALMCSTPQLREVLADDGELHHLLRLYAQATIAQLSQNVACNRLHSTRQRAARWLLMSQDRVGRDRFLLTQKFIAQMLGVRRATVSDTASALQDQGYIRYTRGVITILNREGLEELSCVCYKLIREETELLLG